MIVKKITFIAPTLFLFLIYFSPRTNLEAKLVVMTVTIMTILFFASKKLKINKSLAIGLTCFVIVVIAWSSYGLLLGNPGTLDFFRLYGVWPLLYYFLFLPFTNAKLVKWFFAVSVVSLLIISVYIFYSCLKEFGFPVFPLFEIDLGTRVGVHEGYLQVTSHNVGMLSFLVPMIVSAIMHADRVMFEKKIALIIVLLISIVAAIMSGRRAVWLTILLSPLSVWMIAGLVNKKLSLKMSKGVLIYSIFVLIILVLGVLSLSSFSDWNPDSFLSRLDIFFEGGDDIRREQGKLLIASFLESPIFGKGPGIGVQSLVRSEDASWSYELTYHLLLHNLGLVGFLLFFSPYILLFGKVLNIVKSRYVKVGVSVIWPLHLLNASIQLMISSASNPYLGSFDFLIAIFCLMIPINFFSHLNSKSYAK
jgi:hypothetical protein